MTSSQSLSINLQPSVIFSSPAFSAGSVRAKQSQYLPFPHHQYFQGDDVRQ